MHHALAQPFGRSKPQFLRSTWQPRIVVDDPLEAMRGIVAGALISILGFWLPLALVLVR